MLLPLVEDGVEDQQDQEGGVVGDHRLGAGELSLIEHVEEGAEEGDPRNTVQGGLHQQEHLVQCCERVPLGSVSVSKIML